MVSYWGGGDRVDNGAVPEIEWSGVRFQAPVMYRSPGQGLNPHIELWLPSSNGYLVHRFKVGSTVALLLVS